MTAADAAGQMSALELAERLVAGYASLHCKVDEAVRLRVQRTAQLQALKNERDSEARQLQIQTDTKRVHERSLASATARFQSLQVEKVALQRRICGRDSLDVSAGKPFAGSRSYGLAHFP
eukprot:gnl/TRDRNA2_/TRDRNA2_175187_c0_seq4.p2 gnl/TRDRNA2_/TRDRNA2_175187_c0~~gnl/TRDRNA2_/TRDRNA2_175187_c0_seq4.p2  ORF type:complete len:120 (-),score=25.98 gnl/TRDRNA2_/TRDRNA2_175187_c0_seq4:401-760(-)